MTELEALREVAKHARPICDAIMSADAAGQSKIKLDDVIEDAVHLGLALDALQEATDAR